MPGHLVLTLFTIRHTEHLKRNSLVISENMELVLAYQRYFWKGLYAAVHATPMWQTFKNENGDKVGNGFIIFNTYRIGYHFKLFKDRFFIEPSLGVAGRPIFTEMPSWF